MNASRATSPSTFVAEFIDASSSSMTEKYFAPSISYTAESAFLKLLITFRFKNTNANTAQAAAIVPIGINLRRDKKGDFLSCGVKSTSRITFGYNSLGASSSICLIVSSSFLRLLEFAPAFGALVEMAAYLLHLARRQFAVKIIEH